MILGMLYNASIYASLGVTPNQLRFRYDICDNPLDVLLGQLGLGPSYGVPLELAAKMMQEIELVVKIACENSSLAIQRNGRYYQNWALAFSVGDLVFTFTELQGDPTLHWKLKMEWPVHIPGSWSRGGTGTPRLGASPRWDQGW